MRRGDVGFSLIELLVTMLIGVAVAGATAILMSAGQRMFAAQPELSDMQQRLRIGVEALRSDLLMAGAGAYSGPMTGPLGNYFAPILPFRVGTATPDPASSFFADRLTVMYVPDTSAQTSIGDPVLAASADLRVAAEPGCPYDNARCGFETGMAALIWDDSGWWDAFHVTSVEPDALHLQHNGGNLNKAHPAGSYIAQVKLHTYWLKTDVASETYQLMRSDGNQTDVPIADNVVGMSFDYFGDPAPPQLKPGPAPAPTYGPRPPELGVDDSADSWGPGENCVFMVTDGVQTPRLAWLGTDNSALVQLKSAGLTDGPWCPDPAAAGRYDADLLRIRKVRVTLRVQASGPQFRGAQGLFFARGGTAKTAEGYLPDLEIKFDVTPRNLNLGR